MPNANNSLPKVGTVYSSVEAMQLDILERFSRSLSLSNLLLLKEILRLTRLLEFQHCSKQVSFRVQSPMEPKSLLTVASYINVANTVSMQRCAKTVK